MQSFLAKKNRCQFQTFLSRQLSLENANDTELLLQIYKLACLVSKKFPTYLSHRIFGHMHEALNVVEKNNSLHSLTVNDETNLLNLISV